MATPVNLQEKENKDPLSPDQPNAPSKSSRKRELEDKAANTTAPKKINYTYELRNGWHCRVPVKMSPLYDFSLKRKDKSKPRQRTPSAPGELFKDERFECPDCAKWYGGDKNHIQRSCHHRTRYDTPEELAMWDIGFSDDDD